MDFRDGSTFFLTVGGAFGWFYAWWKHRELRMKLRGINGWKFRAMWRDYAKEHNIPINGEDSN